MSSKSDNIKSYDPLRDSWLRYLGYANEVGEAFRPLVPKIVVRLSYGVATTYVLADVYSKTEKKYMNQKNIKSCTITAFDVFLWQMFASVIIPGVTINRITALSSHLLRATSKSNPRIRFVPTAIGLLSIPLIIHPIDEFVTYVMDNTYRKYLDDS